MTQLVMMAASIMVGVGCALIVGGIFHTLMTLPLAMSIVGGLFSGATYYGMYRIVA